VRRRDAGDGVDASEQRRLESIGFAVESAQQTVRFWRSTSCLFFIEGAPGQQPPASSQNGWRLNRRATKKQPDTTVL
jgi:hypothetical protein